MDEPEPGAGFTYAVYLPSVLSSDWRGSISLGSKQYFHFEWMSRASRGGRPRRVVSAHLLVPRAIYHSLCCGTLCRSNQAGRDRLVPLSKD